MPIREGGEALGEAGEISQFNVGLFPGEGESRAGKKVGDSLLDGGVL